MQIRTSIFLLICAILLTTCAFAAVYPGNPRLSRRAATEGMVLLKNDNSTLPLTSSDTVAIFGKGQIDFIKGGYGSGDTVVEYVVNLLDGMRNRSDMGAFSLCADLAELYSANKALTLTEDIVSAAKSRSNAALFCVNRT